MQSIAGWGDGTFVGLPERTFVRRFIKATGLSPLEYVHLLRLEEGRQILETEECSIEAVAAQVGYEDTSFFGRLFRRKVGLTPAHYGYVSRFSDAPCAARLMLRQTKLAVAGLS